MGFRFRRTLHFTLTIGFLVLAGIIAAVLLIGYR
jgi:hypothetical protein